jgi:ribonuclease HI
MTRIKMSEIYIDGGCSPNPGIGTIGIFCRDRFRCGLKLSETTTNNRMEYVALYGALRIAQHLGLKTINIHTDSNIVATTFNNKNYGGGKNATLHSIRAAFKAKADELSGVSIRWVAREGNTDADELTNIAYDNEVWEGLELIDKEKFIAELQALIVDKNS